jgi:hypothetical protein
MNYYSDFVVSFGLMFVLIGAVAAWHFKASSAGLVWKLALPFALVILACHTPLAVNGLLGMPVDTSTDALPSQAQLVAFHIIDDEKRADLWLLSGAVPKAYQVPLDDKMKRVLKAAQAEMQGGRPAFIRRKGPKREGRQNGTNSLAKWDRQEHSDYELIPGAALLPEKP